MNFKMCGHAINSVTLKLKQVKMASGWGKKMEE